MLNAASDYGKGDLKAQLDEVLSHFRSGGRAKLQIKVHSSLVVSPLTPGFEPGMLPNIAGQTPHLHTQLPMLEVEKSFKNEPYYRHQHQTPIGTRRDRGGIRNSVIFRRLYKFLIRPFHNFCKPLLNILFI